MLLQKMKRYTKLRSTERFSKRRYRRYWVCVTKFW